MATLEEIKAAHPDIEFQQLPWLPYSGAPMRLQVVRYGRRGVDEWIAVGIADAYCGGIVPETRILGHVEDHRLQSGSRQLYVAHPRASEIPDLVDRLHTLGGIAEIAKLVALDCLIQNTDRHEDNWLLTPDNRVVAIDNEIGDSFKCAQDFSVWDYCRPAARIGLLEDRTHLPLLRDAILPRLANAFSRLPPGTIERVKRQFNTRLATLSRRHQYGCPYAEGGVPLINLDLEAV